MDKEYLNRDLFAGQNSFRKGEGAQIETPSPFYFSATPAMWGDTRRRGTENRSSLTSRNPAFLRFSSVFLSGSHPSPTALQTGRTHP